MSIDKDDADALRNAVKLLEHPSLAARITNLVGKPVELMGRALPAGASEAIATATTKSLEAALKVALLTIRNEPQESSRLLHRTLAVASGAAGGAFGIFSLPLELPVSTIIILRSILDIARSEGENLTDPESTLSCVEVLGLGGRAENDDAVKSDYFFIRGLLAKSVTEAARFIAERGIVEEGSLVLVRLITQVASRFGLVVTQKAGAQTSARSEVQPSIMHLSTTSSRSPGAISPSEDLNESTAKKLFSLLTSGFGANQTHELCLIFRSGCPR
jgi:hypothetical protein